MSIWENMPLFVCKRQYIRDEEATFDLTKSSEEHGMLRKIMELYASRGKGPFLLNPHPAFSGIPGRDEILSNS